MREYLKNLRKQAGLNQTQVANKLGVTQAYIAQLERGRMKQIKTDLAVGLAKIYGVDVRVIVACENRYITSHR